MSELDPHQWSFPGWADALRGRDVVIISPQFWGDYWVSKHWIAHELSRSLHTVFIEPPVWSTGVLRSPWKQRAHLGRLVRSSRRIGEQLFVLSPLLHSRALGGGEESTVARTAKAVRSFGIRRPIVLNFETSYELVERLEPSVSVYYCVDPFFPSPGHERDEEQTCRKSDLVYAISDAYRQRLAPFCAEGQSPHVIPHGYSFDHARRIADDPAAGCPPELTRLPRPILGFVGSIHDAYVDIDRVERLARAKPESSIVLIGPYRGNPLGPDLSSAALRRLRQLRNVHLLGPRHFLQIPRYIKHFDVCLVLVNIKDYGGTAKTATRTHFKWLAYLSMGKPVVAPNVREAETIGSLVYLSPSDEADVANIDRALRESPDASAPRVAYASQFSFGRTLDSIAEPIYRVLTERDPVTLSSARDESVAPSFIPTPEASAEAVRAKR